MIQIDAEAAGRALFDETFQGTLPLLPTWEEQPKAFRDLMMTRAAKVAYAALSEVPDAPIGDPPPEPGQDAPDEEEDDGDAA